MITYPSSISPFASPATPCSSPIAPFTAAAERDRRIAESLQRVLLRPHPCDTLPGLSVASYYEAALDEASVGGDSFDAFPLTRSRSALMVADASGKGLEAAERIAEVRFALRAFLREHDDPRRALWCLNNFVCSSQHLGRRYSGSFSTLTLVVLNNLTGEMTCLCAGGEPPLVLRGGGAAKTISVCGPALGLYPNLSYASRETCLGQGDILLLATDGITEARRPANHGPARPGGRAYLGLEGLARLARQSGQMEKASLVQKGQSIFDGARAFAEGTFHDDACLLIARREPSLAAI